MSDDGSGGAGAAELSGVTNMCKAVNIEGFPVKATFCSRVCVGGEEKRHVVSYVKLSLVKVYPRNMSNMRYKPSCHISLFKKVQQQKGTSEHCHTDFGKKGLCQ